MHSHLCTGVRPPKPTVSNSPPRKQGGRKIGKRRERESADHHLCTRTYALGSDPLEPKNGELETFKPSVTINPSDFQPIPDGDNEGAANAANAPSGGMAAGASETSGAPAPGGSQGVSEAVFEKMKAKGLLDKDMTFDQFVALQEEGEENGGGGEGGGGGE